MSNNEIRYSDTLGGSFKVFDVHTKPGANDPISLIIMIHIWGRPPSQQ